MKKIIEQSHKSRDLVNVSILLTVALCIGIYLIITTTIIAKDGVTFIKYGQQIASAPVETLVNEFQHPGYPFLIAAAYRMTGFLHEDASVLSWIYCAQGITLVFRLLAIIVLYFIGKQLFGSKMSFWGVLILILLPKPAEYGSDALSDWPHLFFLLTGILLLLRGALDRKWWLFGLAGVAAGGGYLIRPECAQIVICGLLWLLLQLFWSKRVMSKSKTVLALLLLCIGFCVLACPYMKLKGAVFPKKNLVQLQRQVVSGEVATAGIVPSDIGKAFGQLFENTGETVMWFFVPALFVGMRKWFKGRRWYEPEKFFVMAVIALNIPVMILLYCKYGYMSGRHTLPLLIIPILYVPVGLQELAIWCNKTFSRKVKPSHITNRNERFWFLALLVIGVSICMPRLFRPIRIEKQGYRATAQWLKANTDVDSIVAVPDKRICFYAERRELVYKNRNIPEKAEYIVEIFKKRGDESALMNPPGKLEYEYVGKRERSVNALIYRKL